MDVQKRYLLIGCEIMFREICFCAAKSRNIIDIAFMPKRLHDVGSARMAQKLQEEIDKTASSKYDAILLCYGLCNNGIIGLSSASLPIVVPKAHDCITLLMGSRERYNEYFRHNPGTFYQSPGWIERDEDSRGNEQSVTSQLGMNRTWQEYAEKYGEENAKYIMQTLGGWHGRYRKLAYIDTKTGDSRLYKEAAKSRAFEHQWEYEEIEGDTGLIMRLMDGEWDGGDFFVAPPNLPIAFDCI